MRRISPGSPALRMLTLAAIVVTVPVGLGGFASATQWTESILHPSVVESARAADGSKIVGTDVLDSRNIRFRVYSAAMDREILVDVQRPADTSVPRPTLYLLNGGGGGEDEANWQQRTDAIDFLADKNVNVVQPIGGRLTYYTDWRAPDPELGVNMWKTFFTEELPPLMDTALGTTGANAIAGLSMGATSALQLAVARPGLFKSVASYSGCAQISDPIGYKFVQTVVGAGGGKTVNMYGPQDDPMWAANDPYIHADQLRGTHLFISSGSGLPGRHDVLDSPFLVTPGMSGLANQVAVGGALEAATEWCTINLRDRLNELDIPATYDLDSPGTHSWGYWQDMLKASWPVLARGLGL